MIGFPEDDEFDEEQAQEEINGIDREMSRMADRRHQIKRDLKRKQLDPVIAKMVWLAQNMGHALGANEALGKRIGFLEKRIKARDEALEEVRDYWEWRERAEKAEATIKRRRARR